MLRNTNVTFFNDDRYQIKDVERLHRKALWQGYSNKPINKRKFKQYNENNIMKQKHEIRVCRHTI